MISFIQQVLQKHHKWVFSVLLAVIIIAFVFTIGATPGIVGKKKSVNFYGVNLLSHKEIQPIINSTIISAIALGQNFSSREELDAAVLKRCALLAEANKLLIPEVNNDSLTEFIKTIPSFLGDKGNFEQEQYNTFLKICEQYKFSQDDIRQALIDDQRISVLARAITGNGYFADRQEQMVLESFYSKYNIILIDLPFNSYQCDESFTDDELHTFYEQHAGRYSMPDMVAVSMVRFDKDKYVKMIPNPTDDILDKFLKSNKDEFNEIDKLSDSKEEVLKKYFALEASKLANKYADEFAYTVYKEDVKFNSERFKDLLSQFDLKKEKIALYSKHKLPVVPGVPEAAFITMCDLDIARYYSDPFVTDFGAVVLFVEGRKPARELSFEEAEVYIKKDVYEQKKQANFSLFVENLRKKLSEAQDEREIIKICDGNNLQYRKYQEISMHNDSNVVPPNVWSVLYSLNEDKKVGIMSGQDNISLVVMLNKETPNIAEMEKNNNDKVKKALMRDNQNFEFMEYSNDLVKRELDKLK